MTAAHSRLRRSWPLTERLRRSSTARLRRDTLIRLGAKSDWVLNPFGCSIRLCAKSESDAKSESFAKSEAGAESEAGASQQDLSR